MNLARAVRTLHRQQWVPRPLETVFDSFEHPDNLTLITPAYHVRVLGWTTRWQSLIAEYDPPYAGEPWDLTSRPRRLHLRLRRPGD